MTRLPRVNTPPDLLVRRPLPTDNAAPLQQRLADDRGTQWMRGQWVAAGPHANRAQVARVAPPLAQSVWFDGMAWGYAPVFHPGRNVALAPMFLLADGYAGCNVDNVYTQENGDQWVTDPYVALWNAMLAAGLTVGHYSRATNLGTRIGAQFSMSAQRTSRSELRDRPTEGPTDAGRCNHTFSQRFGITASAFGALAVFGLVRLIGRVFEAGWLHKKEYTTELPVGVSTALDDSGTLQPQGGWRIARWLRNFFSVVSRWAIKDQPDLEHLARLQVGDAFSETWERTRAMVPAVGVPMLYLGFMWGWFERRSINVSRPADGTYQVQIRQDTSRQPRFLGVVPGGLFFNRGGSTPQSSTWTFTFTDLAACQRFAQRSMDTGHNLAQSIRDCSIPWNDRIDIDGSLTSQEMGLRFCLFPSEVWQDLLPRGFGMGSIRQRSNGTLNVDIVTRGDQGRQIHQRHCLYLTEAQQVAGPLGQTEHTTRAIVQSRPDAADDDEKATRLLLVTQFEATMATPDQLNRQIVEPLNREFFADGDDVPDRAFSSSHFVTSRSVQLSQGIDDASLQRWDAAALGAATAPLNTVASGELVKAFLDAPPNLDARAHAVARFVQKAGRPGMAAIYRFHHAHPPADGHTASPEIHTNSAAYERLGTEATRLERRYPQPLQPLRDVVQDERRLLQRLADVDAALVELEHTRGLLRGDPFLSQRAVAQGLAMCDASAARLRLLVRPPQTNRRDALLQQQAMRRVIRRTYRGATRQRLLEVYDLEGQRLLQKASDLQRTRRSTMLPAQSLQPLEQRLRRRLEARVAFVQADLFSSAEERRVLSFKLRRALDLLDGRPTAAPLRDSSEEQARQATLRRLTKLPHVKAAVDPREATAQAVHKLVRRTDDLLDGIPRLPSVDRARRLRREASYLTQQLRRLQPSDDVDRATKQQALARLGGFDATLSAAVQRSAEARRSLAAAIDAEMAKRST